MERTARVPVARAPVRGPKRLLRLRPDTHLVELVRAGDAAAFEVLYERHVAGVLGFCRHMLGSQEEAEDAVQQAFVSAHDAMRRNSREIVFKPWLYTIARNRCLSILRARREQPSELPELSTAGLNEEVEQRADLRELVRDVQRLPEQQRAALVLSELGDLSHAEVAEVIGQEPQAVKGLVFRARAALAERRDARGADCGEIRVELAGATGGGLRRGRLRYHLESCPGCVAYLDEVRRQRRLLGLALPVVPTLALKDSVLGSLGIGTGSAGAAGLAASGGGGAGAAGATAAGGGGAAGAASAGGAGIAGVATAGGAAAAGGTLLGGAAVKLAVAGAILAGGAGVATEVASERGDEPAVKAPAATRDASPGASGGDAGDRAAAAGKSEQGTPSATALERRRGARGEERRRIGQQRAGERSGGRSAAGEPHGKGLGRERGSLAPDNGKPASGGQGGALGRGQGNSAPVASPPRQDAGAKGPPADPGSGAGAGDGSPNGASPPVPIPRSHTPATPPPATTRGTRPDEVTGDAGNASSPLD